MKAVISFILAIAIAIFLLKIVLKVSINIIGFLINSFVGAIVIWILNLIGLGSPITWLTSTIVGLFGVPGVLVILAMKFLFKVI